MSGITTLTRYPLRRPTKAREMPVFPLVGSRMVHPGRSFPSLSAWLTI